MTRSIFTHHPTAMARIPLRPVTASAADTSTGLLPEGIFLASRSAAQATTATPQTAATWSAYDIRSRTRTTPHGVFTGVATASFGTPPVELRLGGGNRALSAPSPDWLAHVAERALDDPGVLSRLLLTSNNLAVQRGERLEAEHPAASGAHRSSVRSTEVSLWLLDVCAGGAPADKVLAELAHRHPTTSETAITGAVRQMINSGLLLTDLLPADLHNDPLGHLLTKVPSSAALRSLLGELRDLLARADAHPPGAEVRLPLLKAACEAANKIVESTQPLTVDTLADANITLPQALGEQAAQAASVLWQLGQFASPVTRLHQKFLAAYGPHRMVPLLEAIDPVTGIGPPDQADAIGAESVIAPERAAKLARLLAQSTTRGEQEVALDDALIRELAHGSPAAPPRTAEIHVRLVRRATGELSLAVCPDAGSQDAGSAPGRWARLLPQLAPEGMQANDHEEPLIAEVVCRPRTARTSALAVETGFALWRIPLGVPARDGDLTPDDLLLTSNGEHLMLWSARHDRQIIPVVFSRLAGDLLPPAARALQLIGHAGTRPWHTWSWGPAARHAPYAPRVRYKNILLTPARWTLPHELREAAAERRTWDTALALWQAQTLPAPPQQIVVQESDRHLPLNLDEEEQREVFRRCVHRGAHTLTEPLGGPDAEEAVLPGPGGSHLLELVVPLTRGGQAPVPPYRDPRTAARPASAGRYLPGSEWLSIALVVPDRLQDTVLSQLHGVLNESGSVFDRSFWLRYATPALGPHLRLRFHGRPEDLTGRLLPRIAALAAALEMKGLASGLHTEPYVQEIERYGGPAAIAAAEEVFATDSTFALHTLADAEDDERMLLAAVSVADIVRTLSGRGARTALRPGQLSPKVRRRRDALRPRLRDAADPAERGTARLDTAWANRHEALMAYRSTLAERGAAVSALCASDMVHMHCNRLLGPDPTAERIARTLAADLLHRPA